MPTTPPSLTLPSAAPDPNDRSTYNARAYPWSVSLGPYSTSLAALAANVYDNAVEVAAGAAATAAAVAAANFKGAWSTLTGALAVPSSVAYGGSTWLLLSNVADVTAHTPGVSGVWQPLPSPNTLGASIASAATVNLDAATGDFVHITGTTTIAAITLSLGVERTVVFDSALTLNHGASLVLPGAVNIVTAPGDRATLRGDSGGVVRCIHYTKANGQAVTSQLPGWNLLAVVTAAASATVDLETAIDATYDSYVIVCNGVTPSATATLQARVKVGGSYTTSTYAASTVTRLASTVSSPTYIGGSNVASIQLINTSATTAHVYEGMLTIFTPYNTTRPKTVLHEGALVTSADIESTSGAGNYWGGNGAVTGVRLFFSTGNIAAGTFRLYGIRKV